MKTRKMFFINQLLCILFVLSLVGCSSMGGLTKPDFSAMMPPGPPAKSIAVWEPAVKQEVGQNPKRGFGGRVYFYDQEAKKPIKVKGNVVVYAFDEGNRKADDNVPTRSYVFDKNDVKKLYSKSKMGHSYNFWIPWDGEGPEGNAKKISLIVRFVPDVGSSVVSSQAVAYLPGKLGQSELTAKVEWETQHQEGTIQQVAFNDRNHSRPATESRNSKPPEERAIEENGNRPIIMKTTTIPIEK